MNRLTCTSPIATSAMLAYWFAEDVATEALAEEHLMGCAHCSARLEKLLQLGDGIRQAIRDGKFHGVFSNAFLGHLRANGVRVREYHLQAGGSVACTIAPDDDLVVSHLRAPLADVQRLDLVFLDLASGQELRMADVAFDPAAEEIVLAPNSHALRALGSASQQLRLMAVTDGSEREIGRYTFNHYRFTTGA